VSGIERAVRGITIQQLVKLARGVSSGEILEGQPAKTSRRRANGHLPRRFERIKTCPEPSNVSSTSLSTLSWRSMSEPPIVPEPSPAAATGVPEGMGERLLKQAFELWIEPEMARRREAGRIDANFQLLAAQVIFNADTDAPEIRLNEEVKAVLEVRVNRAIEAGELITWADVSELARIRLTDEDPNAGHLTLVLKPEGWWIAFDFRYNAERIAQTLQAAQEFLDSAASSLERGHHRAFVDGLFSATELLARGVLLTVPDKSSLSSRKHTFVATRYNLWGRLGNVPRPYVDLLNALSRLRPKARYLDASFALDPATSQSMLATAREMLEFTTAQSPKRVSIAPTPAAAGPGTSLPTSD
jgi:hypothetical protein